MKINKPEVVAYATHHDVPMLFPRRKEAAAYCDDGEDPVALICLSEYEELQTECQILESELATVKKVAYGNVDLLDESEKLRNILSQVATAVGGYADPSCSLEFMAEIPREVESVVQRLVQNLVESRANDRQAMYYLNQVRGIVGGDDFPDMVRRCEKLRKDAERYRKPDDKEQTE